VRDASWIVPAALLSLTALGGCSESDEPTQPNTPEPVTVRVAYCNGNQPNWVAFQDGDNGWTHITPVTMGDTITYQYVFGRNSGGIATQSSGGGGLTILEVFFGTPTELATVGNTKTIYCGTPASKALLGTVAGVDTNESALIAGHISHTTANPAGMFALMGIGSGPHDLFAARHTRSSGPTALTRIIVRRAIDLPDSTVLPVLDFGSPEAIVPVTGTVTVTGLGPEGATTVLRVITRTSEVLLSPLLSASTTPARPYAALPLGELRTDDIQGILASAVSGSATRTAEFYFQAPGNPTLALPTALTRPTIDTVATTPALRLRARYVAQADFDRQASIQYQQGTTTIVGVSMTAAYAALSTNGYELVVPDLSGVTGFNSAWALHPGSPTIWTAGRIGGTVGLGVNAIPSEGAVRRSAFDTDTIP